MFYNAHHFPDNAIVRNDVYQSNLLIQARKDFDLTSMRIFILGLQGLNPHFSPDDKFFDEEFKEIFFPASKLAESLGSTRCLPELKVACSKLFNATIELERNGSTLLSRLFRKLEYVPGKGLLLCFDDILKPYLLNLSEAHSYTRIDAKLLLTLSSTYAIRLLEVMLQYRNFEKFKIRREIIRTLKVSELRFMLNVPEGTYQGRLNNFKKFVLENPVREINERTNYRMSLQTIKSGRQIVA